MKSNSDQRMMSVLTAVEGLFLITGKGKQLCSEPDVNTYSIRGPFFLSLAKGSNSAQKLNSILTAF